jgi:hypothetical protein
MLFVALDPAIIAVPNHANTQDDAEEIIGRIIHWANPSFYRALFRPVTVADILTFLSDGNFFPSAPNIKALLDMWQLGSVYSSEDIRRSINFILERVESAFDAWGIEVLQGTLCGSIPDLSTFRREPLLFGATINLLSSTLLATHMKKQACCCFVSGFPGVISTLSIKITAESGEADAGGDLTYPVSVYGDVSLVQDLIDVARQIGPERIWQFATNSDHLHFAISIKAILLLKQAGNEAALGDLPNFLLGSNFAESARRCGATGNGSLSTLTLESCARILIDSPKNEISPFKKPDSTGKLVNIRRARDNADGFRTHLTKSGVAYRLMFWRNTQGVFEFSNIGGKSELIIEEGDAGRAVGGLV